MLAHTWSTTTLLIAMLLTACGHLQPRRRHPTFGEVLFSLPKDEGIVGRLAHWGNQLVTLGPVPRVINNLESARIQVDGLDEVLWVAGDSVRYAIGLHAKQLTLKRENNSSWSEVPLPFTAEGLIHATLGASGDELAVCWSELHPRLEFDDLPERGIEECCVGHEQAWRQVRVLNVREQGGVEFLVRSGNRWLFGYSAGEFSGSIWSLGDDFTVAQKAEGIDMPVRSILPARDGSSVVTFGVTHLIFQVGHAAILNVDNTWRVTPLIKSETTEFTGADRDATGQAVFRPRDAFFKLAQKRRSSTYDRP